MAVNDAINFAVAVRNLDTLNSRGLQVMKADGTVLLQVDSAGVKASPDGSAATAVVTANATQTLTAKTLNGPTITGGMTVTAGSVNLSAATTPGPVQFGLGATTTFSNASSSAQVINALAITPNTFTSPFLAQIRAQGVTFGTGQSITGLYGLYVDPVAAPAGVTNNYGVYINAPSGASAINTGLYNGGSTVLAGGVSLGTGNGPPGSGVYIGGATPAGISGVLTMGSTTNAAGGGVTATLGTIGGSGPTQGVMQYWLKITVDGFNRWLPVWG